VGFAGPSLGYMNHDCRLARLLEGDAQGEHVTFL
jgi:hypothetical protein